MKLIGSKTGWHASSNSLRRIVFLEEQRKNYDKLRMRKTKDVVQFTDF